MAARMQSFPAPTMGWIKNASLMDAPANAAEVLDNWFPTAQGIRMRNGNTLHATIGAAVKSLFAHRSGGTETLFAASASDVYDITSPADPEVAPTADISSLTSGDWASESFANATGDYLFIANGADSVRHFNGTTWATPSITGVTSADLSQVWSFKERLFFVEKDTFSAWYLAVNAISGAATELPLDGVFHLGGSLLFGATWSLDSGSGLDDLCVFVTDQGEIAVYSGTNPASFTLQGVYRIGKPLSKTGWFRAGGDLAILTEDGIVSVSEALRKDRAALMASALTFPIEDAWQEAVASRSSAYPFSVTLWHSKTMLVVGVPQVDGATKQAFVANARTGAWCRFTGWDVQCSAMYDDTLYFGTSAATIHKAESGGNDAGVEYRHIWVPKFLSGNGEYKRATAVRYRGRTGETQTVALGAFADFATGSAPTAAPAANTNTNVWGTGLWGTMVWGGSSERAAVNKMQTVKSAGYSLAPVATITSNKSAGNNHEAIALDLYYQTGRPF